MDYDKGSALLSNTVKGFHGRIKKMYGQIFLRLDKNTYLSTGGNAPLSEITPDNYILCDINTGDMGEIFRRCPNINALIIGVSQDTVKVSQRDTALPVALEDLAHLTGHELAVIPDASPDSVCSALSGASVCLIKGIGVLSAASNLRKAAAGIQIVAKACEAEVHGALLGGTVAIPEKHADACRYDFSSDYIKRNESSEVAYMGFDESEFGLRSQLIDYGHELVNKDLAYGSWGNLSVKLNDHEMLITPSSMDYFDIRPEDIVKMDINTLDYGKQRIPSGTAPIHASIYREIPSCKAIIHTHSNAVSVFAACRAGFTVNDPALRELIGDILVIPAAYPGTPEIVRNVTDTMKNTHAAIAPHHGGFFTGPSLEVVLPIAEAVEMRARNILGYTAKNDEEEEEAAE